MTHDNTLYSALLYFLPQWFIFNRLVVQTLSLASLCLCVTRKSTAKVSRDAVECLPVDLQVHTNYTGGCRTSFHQRLGTSQQLLTWCIPDPFALTQPASFRFHALWQCHIIILDGTAAVATH